MYRIYSIITVFLWVGGIYSQDGNATCSPSCVQSTCNDTTGQCILGCVFGYAGPSCNIQCCPSCKNCTLEEGSLTRTVCHQCAGNYYQNGADCISCSPYCAQNTSFTLLVCRQTDGYCEFGCESGYTGPTCRQSCSDNCLDRQCDRFDASCTLGCKLSVLTGSTCSETCSEGCVDRECNQEGTCLKGCLDGFWGGRCAVCPENCITPTEIDSRTCNETSGVCHHGCVNGTYWGQGCTNECSATCLNQRCEFESGNCKDGCITGYKGPTCLEKDGNATGIVCSPFCVQTKTGPTCSITGECLQGCKPGYAEPDCNFKCCSNCNNCALKEKSPLNIICHNCADNYYRSGDSCVACSPHCANNTNSPLPVCRKANGYCEFGCKTGYTGTTCMQLCSDTCLGNECDRFNGSCVKGCTLQVVTGPICSETCSEGCVERECDQTGICLKGCLDGYWGRHCLSVCNENCTKRSKTSSRTCNETSGFCIHGCVNSTHWGSNCMDECSANCKEQMCKFETGNCIDGCIQGYKGSTCSEKVNTDSTNKTAIGIGIGVAVAVAVAVAVCALVIFCYRRRKKKKEEKEKRTSKT